MREQRKGEKRERKKNGLSEKFWVGWWRGRWRKWREGSLVGEGRERREEMKS